MTVTPESCSRPAGSVDGLAEALRETDWDRFDVGRLRATAQRFSSSEFRRRFSFEVARRIDQRLASGPTHSHGVERAR
jgi:hypothetical protein